MQAANDFSINIFLVTEEIRNLKTVVESACRLLSHDLFDPFLHYFRRKCMYLFISHTVAHLKSITYIQINQFKTIFAKIKTSTETYF